MFEITETQLFNYIKCPLRYDAQYNLGITTQNHPSVNELLSKVANAFLIKLMNGEIMPTHLLKRRWDKVCEENQDIISSRSCIGGLSKLLNMYRWAEDKQLIVADMNMPFAYTIVSHQIQVMGQITEALVPNPKDKAKFELLILDFSDRYPDQAILDTKMKYTLDWEACRQRVGNRLELCGIHVHHVKNNKDFYTFRTKEDVTRLNQSIIGICRGIQNNIFYPRESVMCSQCDMKMYCRAWRGPINNAGKS